ncbi:MAG: cysteine desulfurase family protein [Leptospirales bacterium]
MKPDRAFLDCDNQMPLRPGVLDTVVSGLASYANTMSRSRRGLDARERLENARKKLARALGAQPSEVAFVSSGSEANTWAIERVAMRGGVPPRALMVSPLEHVSLLAAAGTRSRQDGIPVFRVPLLSSGVVDLDRFRDVLPDPPFLVSIQWANPEMGLIQPIHEVGQLVREHGGLLHVDFIAAESTTSICFSDLPIDLLTVSSSRWGGPPGVASLLIRRGVRINPLLEGGFQEDGRRGGVQPIFLAEGWGCAIDHWEENRLAEADLLERLSGQVERWSALSLEGVSVAGTGTPRIPGLVCFLIRGIDGQAALSRLDRAGIEVGTGSSCSADSLKVSHVLSELGVSAVEAQGSIVLSMGWNTKAEEIDLFCREFPGVLKDLRDLAPALKSPGAR